MAEADKKHKLRDFIISEIDKRFLQKEQMKSERSEKLTKLAEKRLFSYPAMKRLIKKFEELPGDKIPIDLEYKINHARTLCILVEVAIDSLKKDSEREFVDLLFFQGLTTEDVAERLFFSRRHAYRWKERIVENLKPYLFGIIISEEELNSLIDIELGA